MYPIGNKSKDTKFFTFTAMNLTTAERRSEKVFEIASSKEFEAIALDIFRFQAEYNEIYKSYLKVLGSNIEEIKDVKNIPFLPIEFFKSRDVLTQSEISNSKSKTFTSSGTTGSETSRHIVADISVYENSFRKGFEHFYGSASQYCILALLPSYLEREGSSLIYMVDDLIKSSGNSGSGFYLHNTAELESKLKSLQQQGQKTILIGVTYALLDFVEVHKIEFPELIIMETGGMKGRRKEIVREELHNILCKGFGVDKIHSEYGMTELLSQAYSKGDGSFKTPPWMKIQIRDVNDPLNVLSENKTGGINVIDLANIYSCSFIATQDLGKLHKDGFEVLGRFDESDIRGCNLMIE
jgi:phenylacetate-coenzyme A ligase PaaK-like adenylate-forming protein